MCDKILDKMIEGRGEIPDISGGEVFESSEALGERLPMVITPVTRVLEKTDPFKGKPDPALDLAPGELPEDAPNPDRAVFPFSHSF